MPLHLFFFSVLCLDYHEPSTCSGRDAFHSCAYQSFFSFVGELTPRQTRYLTRRIQHFSTDSFLPVYLNMTKGATASGSSTEILKKKEIIHQLWLTTDCVCFDVDSTVCVEEAIDELAKFQQVGTLVETITRNAMGGNMSFREALQSRLNLIQPSRQCLEQFIRNHPLQLTEGIVELIDLLHERRIPVYLITGGFHSIVDPVAKQLNIPPTNIFANQLLFNDDGSYAGFDEDEMTSNSGGKGRVVEYLKNKYNYQRLIMIGDGATDMEANANGFIGFGGNVIREKVRDNAPWFVTSFYELIDQLRINATDGTSKNETHH